MSQTSNGAGAFDTKVLKVDPNAIKFEDNKPVVSDEDSKSSLEQAVQVLTESTNPVAFPTETVYGLGGSALSTPVVHAIYAAKNRPADNPLILHVASMEQLERKLNVKIPEIYKPLLDKFWPGPLTILLPVPENTNISSACTVGQSTFAVRMPSHPVARALIAMSDLPLAAPSANASTRPSTTTAEHVHEDLDGRIPIILDGGDCQVGVESTVVDGLVSPPMLLRPGGVSLEEIKLYGGGPWQETVVAKPSAKGSEAVKTPGMKYKHYSPTATVALFVNCDVSKLVEFVKSQEGISKVGLLRTRKFDETLADTLRKETAVQVVDEQLGKTGQDISHNLFSMLRLLDHEGVQVILVEAIEETDEGLAVMNRLSKASSVIVR